MPEIIPSTCSVNCCPNRFLYMRSGLYRPTGLRGNWRPSVNESSDCAGIRGRQYRRSRFLVKRIPSCRVLRGNGRASVPTVSDSGAERRPLYRRSRFPAQGPVSSLLEHLVNAYQVQGGIGLRLLLRGLGAGHLGKQIALVSVVARQQAAAVLQGRQGLRLV